MSKRFPGSGRIALRLELEQGSEPISGRLVAADGTEEAFTGWLELAAAIERATQSIDTNQEAVK
jgi:hypothetical protein